MNDFKTRLIAERDELQERTTKLTNFVQGLDATGLPNEFWRLATHHQYLLRKQQATMCEYLAILNARISALESE